MVPSTACPCFPCAHHQHGLPQVFHSHYPQFHLLAPHSSAALQHWVPLLLDIYLHRHQRFSLGPHPWCDPFFPSPYFYSSSKILTQSPANPHLTSKSRPCIVPRPLAQQILSSSFPNAHQISPRFCCSALPRHKPALCWLPLPDSSLGLLRQPHSPPHNHTSEPSSSDLSLLLQASHTAPLLLALSSVLS